MVGLQRHAGDRWNLSQSLVSSFASAASGDQRLLRVAEDTLHVALRAPLHLGADLLIGRRCLQLDGQVDDRDVDGGPSSDMPVRSHRP